MAVKTLTFSTTINADPATVFSHLDHPEKMLGLQPLLGSLEILDSTIGEDQSYYRYQTVEHFKLAGLTIWKNKILVETWGTPKKLGLKSVVKSPGAVHLTVDYVFESLSDQQTKLTETMQIQCPAFLRNFVIKTATDVQNKTLCNLKERVERSR